MFDIFINGSPRRSLYPDGIYKYLLLQSRADSYMFR